MKNFKKLLHHIHDGIDTTYILAEATANVGALHVIVRAFAS